MMVLLLHKNKPPMMECLLFHHTHRTQCFLDGLVFSPIPISNGRRLGLAGELGLRGNIIRESEHTERGNLLRDVPKYVSPLCGPSQNNGYIPLREYKPLSLCLDIYLGVLALQEGFSYFASWYLLGLSRIGGVTFLSKYVCGKQCIVIGPIRNITNLSSIFCVLKFKTKGTTLCYCSGGGLP